MMGYVKEWLIFYILGVKPLMPGFSEVEISPYLPDNINWVEGKVSTPYGEIIVSYRRTDRKPKVEMHVPSGYGYGE